MQLIKISATRRTEDSNSKGVEGSQFACSLAILIGVVVRILLFEEGLRCDFAEEQQAGSVAQARNRSRSALSLNDVRRSVMRTRCGSSRPTVIGM